MVAQATTMNTVLTPFGLTENEEKVYIGAFKNPLSTGADIARLLRMDKSSTYRAIDKLSSQGFLMASRGKKGTIYQAANPDTLKELYKERATRLSLEKNALEDFILNLKNTAVEDRKTYFVVEKGLEAFKKRMSESLTSKDKLIRERFGYDKKILTESYMTFVTEYAHKRIKNKIFIRQLEQDLTTMTNTFKGFLKGVANPYKEVRKLPPEMKDRNFLRIWDNTINILSFDREGGFITATLKDPYIAEMMKNFYDFVWERSEVIKGALV